MQKLILAILLFTSTAIAQNTTLVTATLLNPAEVATVKDAFVRFELRNYGTNVPVVIGANVILPSFVDVYPDATGLISTNIFSNDKISPTNTYYSVCYYKNGVKFYCCNLQITGTSLNLDNAACNNAVPTPALVGPCLTCPAGPTGPTGPAGPPGPSGSTCTTMTKYKIHLKSHGTYSAAGSNAIHIDNKFFPGGGSSYNAFAPPGGTYWPWENSNTTDIYVDPAGSDTTGDGSIGNPYQTIQHAIDTDIPAVACGWVEIEGDPIPGDDGVDGNVPNDYVIDHGTSCDSLSAISVTDGRLVLRGLSIRNAGYGLLANASSIKLAGVTFWDNCTHLDAGYNSVVYFDKGDLNAGAWCGPTFCYYAEFKNTVPFSGQWSFILHNNSLMSDEDAVDSGVTANAQVHVTASGGGGSLGSLLEDGARVNLLGGMLIDSTAGNGGLFIRHNSFFRAGYYEHDLGGAGGPSVSLLEGSGIDVPSAQFKIKNSTFGVQIDSGSYLINEPTFTNVTKHFMSNVSGGFNKLSVRASDVSISISTLVDTVAFSATPIFDSTLGGIKKITLTGNVTSSTISSPNHGQELTFLICQDGGGGHTFVWPTNVLGAGVIGGTGSKCNSQRFVYDEASANWYAVGTITTNQ